MGRHDTKIPANLSDSIIGFSTFPDQVYRRCIKSGFEFNLMVVGEASLGKSTFINSLFLAEIHDLKKVDLPKKTTEIISKTLDLEEESVRLKMTFVDTPGFGDNVNNSDCWMPIVKYIEEKFAEQLNEETRIERSARIPDHRVHCCLYFIAPRNGLRELDITAMKALQDLVNIVPIIAKADTMTPEEMKDLKFKIREDLKKNEIKIYEFPPPDDKKDAKDHRDRVPFAVVGSNVLMDSGLKRARVRKYAWGTVEVENLEHNDFMALRDILIQQNMMDLIEVTRDLHYENFRFRQMQKSPKAYNLGQEDPFTRMEKEQRVKEKEMKEEQSAKEKIFADKVAEKMARIEESEKELDQQEKEYKNLIREKQNALARLNADIQETRAAHGITSSSGSSHHSPDGLKKKKSSTLSLFR